MLQCMLQRGGRDIFGTGFAAKRHEDLAQYTDWMRGMLGLFLDARYDLKSFAPDEERKSVVAYAIFHATHTGQGGPLPPTGRHMSTDYVYVMRFKGEKIVHMVKIWNAELALKEIGWS